MRLVSVLRASVPDTCERHECRHALGRLAIALTSELLECRVKREGVAYVPRPKGCAPGFAPLAVLHIVRIHVRHQSNSSVSALSSAVP